MKILNKKSADTCRGKSLAVVIIAAILSFSIVSFTDVMTSNSATAQNTTTTTTNNQTQSGQLSFFLKLADNSNQTSAQTSTDPANLKNITVNVNVQQGQEPPKKLPITALVPKATTLEQLELCGSVSDQPEQCQPLSGESISLDLTGGQKSQNNASSAAAAAATTTLPTTQPQSYSTEFEKPQFTNIAFSNNHENYGLSSAVYSPNDAFFVPVQLIDDVNVNVPIDIDVTAIIPINIEIENAQICANLGGTQTCQINNINPTTNEYSPTTIDLTSEEPAVTTQPTAPTTSTTEPTTTAPTTSTTEPTTTAPTTSTTEPTTSTTEPAPEDSAAQTESTESESEPANTEDTESSN